jgi:hypothetical protein
MTDTSAAVADLQARCTPLGISTGRGRSEPYTGPA